MVILNQNIDDFNTVKPHNNGTTGEPNSTAQFAECIANNRWNLPSTIDDIQWITYTNTGRRTDVIIISFNSNCCDSALILLMIWINHIHHYSDLNNACFNFCHKIHINTHFIWNECKLLKSSAAAENSFMNGFHTTG